MQKKFVILKTTALLMAILLLSLSIAGCSGKIKPVKGSKEDLAVVGSCDGFDVLYEELRFVTLYYKTALSNYYKDLDWDNAESASKYKEELEKLVLENLLSNYAILSLCRECMIYIEDEEIQEAIQEQVDQTAKELGGKKQYFEYLKSYDITDHLFRFTLGVGVCENELYIAYTRNLGLIDTDNESVKQHINSEFVRTKHIFIQNDEGEDVEKNRADAQMIRDKLASGENIDDYIGTKYNQDPYITADGYYFTAGEMKEEYENAAFALDIGDVSDVVEVENGFFVILRLALENEYIVNHFDALKEQYVYSVFSKFINEKKESISVVLNEYGRSIDISAIK